MIIGISLLIEVENAVWVAMMAMLAFVAVLTVYRARGGEMLRCGCFGDFENPQSTVAVIVRNMLLAAALLFIGTTSSTTQILDLGTTEVVVMTTSAIFLVILWVLVIAVKNISELYFDERRSEYLQETHDG